MARTKQTPRNPVLERLPTAVGSDVQGKKMPSKSTPKKAIKGGKQPHKHMLHKTTGGVKKPHRYRPGLLALQEIRRYQQSTESLIRKTPLNKLLKKSLKSTGYVLKDLELLPSRYVFNRQL